VRAATGHIIGIPSNEETTGLKTRLLTNPAGVRWMCLILAGCDWIATATHRSRGYNARCVSKSSDRFAGEAAVFVSVVSIEFRELVALRPALDEVCRRGRWYVQPAARLLAVALSAAALAGCVHDAQGVSASSNTASTGKVRTASIEYLRSAGSAAGSAHAKNIATDRIATGSVTGDSLAHPLRSRTKRLIPRPGGALLEKQPEPACDFKSELPDGDDPVITILDYERQCYRHAEIIVRGRLDRLQSSTGETVKAADRQRPGARHHKMLSDRSRSRMSRSHLGAR
jgi:hypothetical protein